MTFELHREAVFQSIAMELQIVQSLKEHLLSFLGLRDLATKFGLGELDLKLYRMTPRQGGRSEYFAIEQMISE